MFVLMPVGSYELNIEHYSATDEINKKQQKERRLQLPNLYLHT